MWADGGTIGELTSGVSAREADQATERNAGEGVGLFSCSKATNEMNFVAQKFMRTALRSNNIDSCNRT